MQVFGGSRKCFFLPVNTGYSSDGLPNDQCLEFYAARSGNGLYCAIVGNVVIPNGYGTNAVCTWISNASRWRELANAIVARGAKAGIQLSSTWPGFEGIRPFVAREPAKAIAEYKVVATQISASDIRRTLDDLASGTELALEAGFTHIQLHAAHGYLFSLLVDERFSPHSELTLTGLDNWVGSLHRSGAECSLRFSLATGEQEIDMEGRMRQTNRMLGMPFNFFDVTSGFYNVNKQLIYPSTEQLLKARWSTTIDLAKERPDKQIILSGKAARISEESLPSNVHVGICRDLIANPNFLADRTIGCTNCMKCHYHSRGVGVLTCGRWTKG
jgi:hypothetical protein